MKRLWILPLILCILLTACTRPSGIPKDGRYTVSVTLSGGSGRASVDTPALVIVKGGQVTATVVWSSPFYEWMCVDGVQYEPVQAEGNATFVILARLDEDMPVTAQTVAMSEPHAVDYTLYFDSSTIKVAE